MLYRDLNLDKLKNIDESDILINIIEILDIELNLTHITVIIICKLIYNFKLWL